MRWIDFGRALPLLGLVLPLAATPVRADVMVVRSLGPSAGSYAPGKVLPDAARITLRPTDSLVLLDAHGTRTLQGPGSYVAGVASTAQTTTAGTLAALVDNRSERRARIGAVRGVPVIDSGPVRRPNIWFVDTAAAGPACISSPTGVTLWRGAAETEGSTTIAAPGGASAKIDWIKGEATSPWPASLPVTDGAEYRVTGAGAAAAGTTIKVRLVPNPPADLQALAGTLISHQCQAQLDVLIATTSNGG